MACERSGLGVAVKGKAKEVVDFALEARGGIVERRQRDDRGSFGGNRDGGMDEPVLPLGSEQVVDLEGPTVLAAVGGGHEDQLGAEADAEEHRESVDTGRADRAV